MASLVVLGRISGLVGLAPPEGQQRTLLCCIEVGSRCYAGYELGGDSRQSTGAPHLERMLLLNFDRQVIDDACDCRKKKKQRK
jgi:hypothetical protein